MTLRELLLNLTSAAVEMIECCQDGTENGLIDARSNVQIGAFPFTGTEALGVDENIPAASKHLRGRSNVLLSPSLPTAKGDSIIERHILSV